MNKFEVLATGSWSFGGGVYFDFKQVGQVTKCRWLPTKEIFYVRENLDGHHAFYVSSNERWGEKHRGAHDYRQVLDLLAGGSWAAIAQEIQSTDRIHRAVRRHRTFTKQWAERHLR